MHPILMIPVALAGFFFGKKLGAKHATATTSGGDAPVPGVSLAAWADFVAKMEVAPKSHVSVRGRLGAFQMDARRLADVGAMTRAWKGRRGAEAGVWVGQWCDGLSEASFLGSMPAQYAVLVRSMRTAAPKVAGFVGRDVDGRKATLSGLLGVCHVAGERGVAGFIEEPEVRRQFSGTMGMFARTNGIF